MLASEERVINRLQLYIQKTQRKLIDETYIITREIQDLYCHALGVYAYTLVERRFDDKAEEIKIDEDNDHIYYVKIIPYKNITEIRLIERWKMA